MQLRNSGGKTGDPLEHPSSPVTGRGAPGCTRLAARNAPCAIADSQPASRTCRMLERQQRPRGGGTATELHCFTADPRPPTAARTGPGAESCSPQGAAAASERAPCTALRVTLVRLKGGVALPTAWSMRSVNQHSKRLIADACCGSSRAWAPVWLVVISTRKRWKKLPPGDRLLLLDT